MLTLICAPAGAGKTDTLIQSIRRDIENQTRCYLLVPEQQAYISERALLEALPENAGLSFEVVNFSALADDAFRVWGGGLQASADAGISALLMWDTLRKNFDLLKQYGGEKPIDAAMTSLMLSAVAELRASGISSDDLDRAAAAEETDARFSDKLSDISLINAYYHARLEEVFRGDPADKLERFAKLLERHAFFEGCNVYIDSFTSFTAPEYAIITAMLKQAQNVTVTLCADAPRSTLPHFQSIMNTKLRLFDCARSSGSEIETRTLPQRQNGKPTELQVLSEDLWNFAITEKCRKRIPDDEKGAVRAISATNIYEEAEAAALYICEQVLSGMRYRDIAVIVRDAEIYRGVLDAALERHGIPYFLSERTELSAKPLSRLLICALRAAGNGFRAVDVVSLLKTGLCGIDPRDGAMFEEYCETWHITGRRFCNCEAPWSMNPDGLTTKTSERGAQILRAANEVRLALIPKLEKLSRALAAATVMEEYCEALYDYLLAIDLPTRLANLAEDELSLNQGREASETMRLYKTLTELLATLCKLLPDTPVSTPEFITALSLLLSNTDLGSVPDVQDCVMIGSASMLRVENVRATLLLGLCEGEFPAAVSENSIFTDREKVFLEGFAPGCRFSTHSALCNSEELFFVYRAIAKPTERLFLSTVKKQTDGSARTPSLAFNRALFLLGISAEEFDASAVLAARMGSSLQKASAALTAPPTVEQIRFSLSQSRISTFVKCPYLHYVKYVLRLRDPKSSTPTYADDGTFLHYVFEKFLKRSLDENGRLVIPENDRIESLSDLIIDEYVKEFFHGSSEFLSDRILHQLARLRRLALLMLRDILAEIKESKFEPVAFEKGIGGHAADALPAVSLRLKNGSVVDLTGTIDRIDACEIDGERFVRVVDYKTGEHVFSPEDVASGSDIQLVLYLHAYLSAHEKEHAYGAQYIYGKNEEGVPTIQRSGFYLGDAEVNAFVHPDKKLKSTKKMKAQSAEEILALRDTMRVAVTGIAERMIAGEARKTPSEDACKYCILKDNCDQACKGKE